VDTPWSFVIPALSLLVGIIVGNWLNIHRERRARIEDARLETYARCIGSLHLAASLAQALASSANLDVTRQMIVDYQRVVGEAELYADEGVQHALSAARIAENDFQVRVRQPLKTGPTRNINQVLSDAMAEELRPAIDELVKQMRRQTGIRT
jgi:hypothetical protein